MHTLREQYENAIAKTTLLQKESEEGARKISKAQMVLSALMKENGSWAERAHYFEEKRKNIAGDVIFSACFVAYGGITTGKPRDECSLVWRTIIKEVRNNSQRAGLR